MGKFISRISIFILSIILIMGYNPIFAASRSLYLNNNNQNNVSTSYMGATAGYSSPIDYLYITGNTSRGAVNIVIYEHGDAVSDTTKRVLQNTTCSVGARMASTGMPSGNLSPIIVDGGFNFVTMSLKKGDVYSPNNKYKNYIASALISNSDDDVMSRSVNNKKQYYNKLKNINDKMELQIQQWDSQNIIVE